MIHGGDGTRGEEERRGRSPGDKARGREADGRLVLIEELCKLTGFSRRTVRYYVQEGLVDPPAGRGRGGYYSDRQLQQLNRIRELQDQGYRLDAIRTMLGRAEVAGTAALEATGDRRSPPLPRPPAEPAGTSSSASWTRHVVAPGVELHVSAEAGARLGNAVAAALASLRSIVEREGVLDE